MTAGGILLLQGDSTKASTTGNCLSNQNGAVLCPVGSIMFWPSGVFPTGWIGMFGQVLAQASFPELFSVIGSTYNTGGEGAGNFRMPDTRGRAIINIDNAGGTPANRITTAGSGINGAVIGAVGGGQNETIAQNQLPNVSPTFTGTPVTPTMATAHANIGLVTGGGITALTESAVVAANQDLVAPFNFAITMNSITPAGTVSSINGGVTQNAVTTMPPTIMMAAMMFAGR
ncbi:MAG TPA: phage tail protein [Candidatus Angelobacter sp.]|nr:phage tail protein [Candidatus Angelobacter sp.]